LQKRRWSVAAAATAPVRLRSGRAPADRFRRWIRRRRNNSAFAGRGPPVAFEPSAPHRAAPRRPPLVNNPSNAAHPPGAAGPARQPRGGSQADASASRFSAARARDAPLPLIRERTEGSGGSGPALVAAACGLSPFVAHHGRGRRGIPSASIHRPWEGKGREGKSSRRRRHRLPLRPAPPAAAAAPAPLLLTPRSDRRSPTLALASPRGNIWNPCHRSPHAVPLTDPAPAPAPHLRPRPRSPPPPPPSLSRLRLLEAPSLVGLGCGRCLPVPTCMLPLLGPGCPRPIARLGRRRLGRRRAPHGSAPGPRRCQPRWRLRTPSSTRSPGRRCPDWRLPRRRLRGWRPRPHLRPLLRLPQ
jgi:hypothetical protein